MYRSERGATLVEVLVALALAAVMLPTLATALATSNAGRATSQQQLKASALVREAAEAMRAIRGQSWSSIATNGTYHPTISGSTWTLASGSETINGFNRQVIISSGQRDGSNALVVGGGSEDTNTKHIEITVSWSTPYNGSITSDLYLTNWQDGVSHTQSLTAPPYIAYRMYSV